MNDLVLQTPTFTLWRGDLLAGNTLRMHARRPGKTTAHETYEREQREARLRSYTRPPRVRALVQAIRFALFSPYSRWRHQ